MDDGDFEWDLFISHASEDQARFVRPLANALIQAGYRVWYSEWALHLGDPLRSTIERGLVLSRYGVVVVSDAFLAKQWPQRELDALFTLEGDGDRRILPIWHNIDESGIRMHSPILADRVAAQSHESLETIVARIAKPSIEHQPRPLHRRR